MRELGLLNASVGEGVRPGSKTSLFGVSESGDVWW